MSRGGGATLRPLIFFVKRIVLCKVKKMFNIYEEKECALGNKEFCFLAGQESQECCVFVSDVGIRGIYWSLTLSVLPNSNN